ncbi:MAG: glutathione-dependent formaldehyde-activating protein [Osedax symbiont Rs2]|nr:MAG: glutathione-dependent formaldehyde-activating protein [Osedax symbiont Rs2]
MSNKTAASGQCLCGAVTITAANMHTDVSICHCSMCRKWGGGPFLATHCGSDVIIEPAEKVKRYRSSAWAERGFCTDCGSHLFYHMPESKEYIMPIGLFEQQQQIDVKSQIFIDEKPGYYDFANQTKNMTGQKFLPCMPPSKTNTTL